ncbi:MAG: putative Histidine kinase, partial [Patescibacteria group bacterium]|nr:putative Histidine kinase [Patescibacteria group bacterium]
ITEDKEIITGDGLYLLTLYLGLTFFLSFSVFIYDFIRSSGRERAQLRLILTGSILATVLGLFCNLLLPLYENYSLVWLGPSFSLIFTTFTIYAIAAHRLFDIRIIVKRTVVYTMLLAFIFVVYSSVIFLLTQVIQRQASGAVDRNAFIANLIAAIVIGFSVSPLRRWLEERTNNFLFKKEYEQQTVLKDLSKRLNDVIAMDEALEMMMQTIVRAFHLRHAVTYVFQQGENGGAAVKRVKQIGYSSTAHLYLGEKDFLVPYFSNHPGVVTVENLKQQLVADNRKVNYIHKKDVSKLPADTSDLVREIGTKDAVVKKLESFEIALALPLHLNTQPIGLILLSDKLSGDGYTSDDLTLLDTIGSQAISAIQKAKLYEGDRMKSEFVSIASHELLTPVSAIEGYLSMILDEHIGQIDDKARDYLTKVYSSSKRLSALVKDLLSVSRIEAGRMKIEPQSQDVSKMIGEAVDQLKFLAQQKQLELTYEQPTESLPPVWTDPDRAMQVLINIISNAIKYTPKGSVTIKAMLEQEPVPHVRISVIDTGMGMSKEDQTHLYEKFYRVDNLETTGIVGTGLGLYITKTLIERMGGTISLESVPGKGSTFSITLPLFKIESSPA